jgi:hypothetical protein
MQSLMPNPRGSSRHLLQVSAFVLVLVLAGCTIRLVSSYDPTLDEGLMRYYQSMDVFLSQMERYAATGNPEGAYSLNVKFYEESGAQIDSLVMRARAAEPKATCIGNDAVAFLAKELFGLKPFAEGTKALDIEELVQSLTTGEDGSCTVQILKAVRANHNITAAIHQHNDKLSKPVVAIIKPTIEQGVRIGVTTELAKKRGEK